MIEDGLLTNSQFEELLAEYQASNEIDDLNVANEQNDMVEKLIHKFFHFDNSDMSGKIVAYLNLLFNDIVRFIGKDFYTIKSTDEIRVYDQLLCYPER